MKAGVVAAVGAAVAATAATAFYAGARYAAGSRSESTASTRTDTKTGAGAGAGAGAESVGDGGIGGGCDADDELLHAQQFKRCVAFLGEEGFGRLRGATVVVVGCGGVGSHCAHMLARSGVGTLVLIDFDQVTLSSLNRHATATWADVGKPKVTAMAAAFAASAPAVKVVAKPLMFTGEAAAELLLGAGGEAPDFVIDCIDNRKTKVDLLMYCTDNDIPVVSSMGAGARADPSRIRVADIMETSADAFARRLRADLRKRGLTKPIPCVYSTEPAGSTLAPLPAEVAAAPDEYTLFPDLHFRVSIIPVLGMVPAMFGNALAAFVVMEISRPVEPVPDEVALDPDAPASKTRETEAERSPLGAELDAAFPGWTFSKADAKYVAIEMWHNVSARRGHASRRLTLVRWDPAAPSVPANLVLVTRKEAKAMSAVPLAERAARYGTDWVAWVESRLAMGRAYMERVRDEAAAMASADADA
ncbi:uncharacterized protein AMSG_06728 [Thecamonas trahens ATCC 50062]|uniref:THIF-type NAD/FAD binding fold domain-containing protein n=1 Tax=Thecamonas trahens ATCC 50062 TaxID=461836 RepID=A0A0L0DF22_THETB|nr:hypothetical protein AMSG_06728 [Thecamonas trahens ATCC 50062]KNC50825.1 hypothetical protein AMSG_06728 [Thecamonas trahens ATCC 50062]|eukprot:XP_013756780.1 hypothetical protein AMSG_06728 [Thecamonas trahens ATCC 50062]